MLVNANESRFNDLDGLGHGKVGAQLARVKV